jgi:hypothetical protein
MLRLGSRRTVGLRHYATVVGGQTKAPLTGLNDSVKARAESLSNWKGTNATGGNTKNYIGGEFVESKTSEWIDVVDPVECFLALSIRAQQADIHALSVVYANASHARS